MPKPSKDSLTPNWLNIEDFEFLCFNFARRFLTLNEPIPDYSTRNNHLLESCLGAPKQTYDGKLLYPTLQKQAAILFYCLIKNHPFRNGNKRIAVMSLFAFLSLNEGWISITPYGLYKLAIEVSESEAKEKNKTLRKIERILTEFIIRSDEP